MSKLCTYCNLEKSISDFSNHKKGKDGKRSYCKSCVRLLADPNRTRPAYDPLSTDRRKAFKNYGISLQEREEFYKKANYQCELCGSKNNLGIDHCHTTGVIRGILCKRCNISIGGLGDTIEGLQKALAYLQKAPTAINLLQLMNKLSTKRTGL
jgi:hypothetical protein